MGVREIIKSGLKNLQMRADGKTPADQGPDWEKVNLQRAAVALGHPIGYRSARVLTALIYALKEKGLKRGMASLCLGGAEGAATAVVIME